MDVLSRRRLPDAAEHLAAGRVVAAPTSRWYMLCARASAPAAMSTLFRIKQRPRHKPLMLLLDSPTKAGRLFDLSEDADLLIEGLWPGDLALRLPWRDGAPIVPDVGSPALVGCPDGVLHDLIGLVGEPLAAAVCSVSTPAARADDHPALTAGDVARFDQAAHAGIAAVVDDGICPHGRHATVVDCPAGSPARLHREGTVHARAIAAALAPHGGTHVG
ncbi:L-threonylcarbamoyladenylate synthase [Streptomyces sp. NPDC054835]|uniref:L-threonylcarbamoyladenylate synthase n=1 Tax=Streptomyces exfoliatus TaxID=1905 RepID=UPI00046350CD|nr:Sua5/YciO/YrdC/YwlC family protein [Streptomyces exfoliatus]